MERIFVSGLGFATCIGNDRETFWKNLSSGVCGLDTLELHDTTDLIVNIGGEVRDLDLSRVNVNDRVAAKRMDRASQFAVYAAHEALEDAGLPTEDIGDRTAVIMGAGLAGLETYEAMIESLREVDLTKITEDEDNTDLTGEAACAGGVCEVKFV